MGKVSIIVGIVAALVVVAVVVVVVVVVVLGGIDTSPITEVTETKAVTVADSGQSLGISDEFYYLKSWTGDTTDTLKYTYALTYRNGDTKSFTFDNAEKKHWENLYYDHTAAYEDSSVTDSTALTFFNPFDTEVQHESITLESEPQFYNEDEFVTTKRTDGKTTIFFYSRDSGNKFVKSSFSIAETGASDAKQTNVYVGGLGEHRDYIVTYDRDNTADKKPKTYVLWNKSGTATFEKKEAEEGVNYTLNDDSTAHVA